EICGRLLCERAPMAGMYRPHAQAPLEWAVKRGRLRYATAMFGREELRPAIRHLRQGGVLWFAPDQETRRGDSVYVPFFGRPASSLTSTHQLARLSGAAVLAFAHERRDDGGYSLRLSPAFEAFPTADASADTARVMAAIEAMARAVPAQYLWIHRRFKRQPDGTDPYASRSGSPGGRVLNRRCTHRYCEGWRRTTVSSSAMYRAASACGSPVGQSRHCGSMRSR